MIPTVQPVRRLTVIEDSTVLSMAGNQRYLAEFPFLAGLTRVRKGGCGRCGRNGDQAQAVNAAKMALANLGPEKKRLLLKLLNTESARIRFSEGPRTVQKTIVLKPD